ncbi:hypothetical protein [Polaromonas jejuensis]|uniref:Uncharacterized protein n=1 Tax=Polaromonas jejuensis TaxID=457502 RepID=A0ABW0Q6J1_9BURK|nr:hypothetical protein [Polaromonas jejuensis]
MAKRWIWDGLFAFAFIAGVIVVVRYFDLTNSAWAAWVQAIGSILAIWGAVRLTQRQIDSQAAMALDAENRALKRSNDALLAVVDGAAKQFLKLEPEMAADEVDDFSYLSFMFSYEEQSFTDAINALESVRLVDLGSYELVEAIAGMKAGMIKLRHAATEAMNPNRNKEEQPDHQIMDYGETVIGRLKQHYGNAAKILGGEPILAATWMDE